MIPPALPRRPARAARDRPFERLALDRLAIFLQPEIFGIAEDHRQIIVLRTGMETEPEAEAVRERNFFLDRFAGIDRAGTFIIGHFAP